MGFQCVRKRFTTLWDFSVFSGRHIRVPTLIARIDLHEKDERFFSATNSIHDIEILIKFTLDIVYNSQLSYYKRLD